MSHSHSDPDSLEAVIGLEVHAQLSTQSKAFSPDPAFFGAPPNTLVGPISLAHPGTLPRLNAGIIPLAVRLGLACHGEITRFNYFDRKNYFYPDLPKGYQITQHATPVCRGGYLSIRSERRTKRVHLHHIHLEEDAGKSVHEIPGYSGIDFNRAGIPLLEIVTMAELISGEEAYQFVTELRKLLRYLGICDGNMEEGSLRCDVNISVRPSGTRELGPKVEVKNLNSIRHIKKAIEYEIKRQVSLLRNKQPLIQQTRSYDAAQDITLELREKEMAHDYRYFPEPDLTPFRITDSQLEEIRAGMPRLPEELIEYYTRELGLSEYDALILVEDLPQAQYYNSLLGEGLSPKAAANWLIGPVKSFLNEKGLEFRDFPLEAPKLASLIRLVDQGILSFSAAASGLLPILLQDPGLDPAGLVDQLGLSQEQDLDALKPLVDEVLASFPDKVKEYRSGKKGLIRLFMGEVMKRSRGKANPELTNILITSKLKEK